MYDKYVSCGYRVTTDSRSIKGGEMFFALRGENFDGNDYALKALESGAKWAVVNSDANLPDIPGLIRVEDPFKALQELAVHHREHVHEDKRLPVIGLTGTNGKTTTKELINAVLSKKFKVTATQGNLNNDIGVPLSLLNIRPETEIAVIEMGASHPDDIAKLVKVSRPDYGLITNVGKAHLLGFGSFEGVKAAKGELYNWLGNQEGSVIFLNADDPDLREMASKQPCHCFEYGLKYQGAQILPSTPEEPFLKLKLGNDIVSTRLVGAYNANNVLAAICIGDWFGVPRKDAIAAIEAYVPSNNRSQMNRTADNTLVIDAYNANPSSMNAALENFRNIISERKVALLGDMRELGADSLNEHIKVVRQLKEMKLEAYLVGEEFRKALEAEGKGTFLWFPDSAGLAAYLKENPIKKAVVLIKGSRGIQMEKAIPEL